MATTGLQTWKTAFLRSLGFGAGFALMLSLIVGLWSWHANKPKSQRAWSTSSIKAYYTDFSARMDRTQSTFDFTYSLENLTDRDYRLPTDAVLMIRLPGDKSYRFSSELSWDDNLHIPSHKKVNISVKLPIRYADYNTSEKAASDEKIRKEFILSRLTEIDGFALFDQSNRCEIDLPNGWPGARKHLEELDSAEKPAKPEERK